MIFLLKKDCNNFNTTIPCDPENLRKIQETLSLLSSFLKKSVKYAANNSEGEKNTNWLMYGITRFFIRNLKLKKGLK